jgi:hypothetical protein
LELNQHLKIQVNELKSLATTSHASVIFNLDNISVNVEEVIDLAESKESVVIGRIF